MFTRCGREGAGGHKERGGVVELLREQETARFQRFRLVWWAKGVGRVAAGSRVHFNYPVLVRDKTSL